MLRTETIGDATLYLGDCREIYPTINQAIGATVTDPPYGIDINKSNRLSVSRGHGGESWDDEAADISWLPLDRPTIIWGGNYFGLPAHRAPLVWDKNNAGRDFADFELAWTNLDMVARRVIYRPMNTDGGKLHPTQKPIEVMRWCVSFLPQAASPIFDPYMGSGTTGIAALSLGRKFIGIEREPKYFDIACRRVEEETRRPDMFAQLERRAAEIQQTFGFDSTAEAAE